MIDADEKISTPLNKLGEWTKRGKEYENKKTNGVLEERALIEVHTGI